MADYGAKRRPTDERGGPRPRTSKVVPHEQLDQWPPAPVFSAMVERLRLLPAVRERESRMATPGTLALWIPAELAHGPAEAFIDDHEFCHIHPLPDGSLHLTLPDPVRQRALDSGWAELHPSALAGYLPHTVAMVYAPRDDAEVEVVVRYVEASLRFARGDL